MDSEPMNDTFDVALREELRAQHARYPAPAFESLWTAAQARVSGPARRTPAQHAGVFAGRLGWALGAIALAAIAWSLLALVTPVVRHQQVAGRAAEPQAVDRVRVALWYAPTDPLLHVASLSYGARPARLTSYDPITMEVKP